MNLLDRCIVYATIQHSGQLDKIGLPYIYHPLRVMLDSNLTTNHQKCIAVLHDVLEDTPATITDLVTMGLPHDIVNALVALTHIRNEPNTQYWQRILDEPSGNAKLVKLADIRDNSSESRLAGLPEADQVRLKAKYEKVLKYLGG